MFIMDRKTFRVSRSLGSVKCDVLCVKGTWNTVHNIQGQDPYSFGSKSDVVHKAESTLQLYLMHIP